MSALSSLPLRPDEGGSLGRPVNLRVNIFPVTQLQATNIFQYDVAFLPEIPPPAARRAWKVIQERLKKTVSSRCLAVFDGRKNAFTTYEMPDQKFEVDVPSDENLYIPPISESSGGGGRGGRGGGRGGRGGGRGGGPPRQMVIPLPPHDANAVIPTERVMVTIRQTIRINMHELLMFTQGKGTETDTVLHASTALAVLIRHVPSMLYTPVGANF
eukprot:jgi/Hompol1/2626/HPOL_006087-RA